MDGIVIAVIVVTVIGLVCGIMLAVASKFMAVPVDERVDQVRECLPGANCGACGFAGCDAYAAAIVEDPSIGANKCVPGGAAAAEGIAAVLGIDAGSVEPMVARLKCNGTCNNTEAKAEWQGKQTCAGSKLLFGGKNKCSYGCIGFGDCGAVCPQNAIDVYNGIAHVDPDLCIGCTLCEQTCPMGVISMIPKKAAVALECSNKDKGKDAMAVCKVSCISCGKCARGCEAGAIEMVDGLPVIDHDKCTGCGKCAAECPRKCIADLRASAGVNKAAG